MGTWEVGEDARRFLWSMKANCGRGRRFILSDLCFQLQRRVRVRAWLPCSPSGLAEDQNPARAVVSSRNPAPMARLGPCHACPGGFEHQRGTRGLILTFASSGLRPLCEAASLQAGMRIQQVWAGKTSGKSAHGPGLLLLSLWPLSPTCPLLSCFFLSQGSSPSIPMASPLLEFKSFQQLPCCHQTCMKTFLALLEALTALAEGGPVSRLDREPHLHAGPVFVFSGHSACMANIGVSVLF